MASRANLRGMVRPPLGRCAKHGARDRAVRIRCPDEVVHGVHRVGPSGGRVNACSKSLIFVGNMGNRIAFYLVPLFPAGPHRGERQIKA
jgi:hypothetical protein